MGDIFGRCEMHGKPCDSGGKCPECPRTVMLNVGGARLRMPMGSNLPDDYPLATGPHPDYPNHLAPPPERATGGDRLRDADLYCRCASFAADTIRKVFGREPTPYEVDALGEKLAANMRAVNRAALADTEEGER